MMDILCDKNHYRSITIHSLDIGCPFGRLMFAKMCVRGYVCACMPVCMHVFMQVCAYVSARAWICVCVLRVLCDIMKIMIHTITVLYGVYLRCSTLY